MRLPLLCRRIRGIARLSSRWNYAMPPVRLYVRISHMHIARAHSTCTPHMHIPHAHPTCTSHMHIPHAHPTCSSKSRHRMRDSPAPPSCVPLLLSLSPGTPPCELSSIMLCQTSTLHRKHRGVYLENKGFCSTTERKTQTAAAAKPETDRNTHDVSALSRVLQHHSKVAVGATGEDYLGESVKRRVEESGCNLAGT
eukprot:1290013-Rhodomonas_salina.2